MDTRWPLWRRLLFRFFFLYLALTIAPWTWLDSVPYVSKVTDFYYSGFNWLVTKANQLIFHVRPELVMPNGSGDTSFGWAELWFVISFAIVGTIIWSLLQRRKKQYTKLNYWLCLFTRYFLILILFSYGIIKLFGLQMPFPNYSQLATPLGDFLPMRLSWLFIGYSGSYQFFSGLMEVSAAMLLLYRQTATLGTILATGVFLNVAVLNLSYDIPVKIFSIQMLVGCLFLLANESQRILCFFVYNRPAGACALYHFTYAKKWMRIARYLLKTGFVVLAVVMVWLNCLDWRKQMRAMMDHMPFEAGLYSVVDYVLNKDTVPPLITDSLRWQNMVFDNNSSGSIFTNDTSFYRRYSRAYFYYKVDTTNHRFTIFKKQGDTTAVANMRYRFVDNNSIVFNGTRKSDSISFRLQRNPHAFQLAERQFHWLSETNR